MKQAVLIFLGFAFTLGASPITYTVTATATGSLGSNSFTNALVTVTFIGDTANVTGGSGFFTNTVGTATVNVAGIGTGTFTDAMYTFDNQIFIPTAAAGIADVTAGPASVLDTFNAAFSTYALATSIGPLSGSPFINSGESFPTTLGGFILTSSGNSTFTALTGTPEPGTFSLLVGGGLLLLLAFTRRSRRKLVAHSQPH